MQRSHVYHWELLDFATHFGIRAEELQVRTEHQSETRGAARSVGGRRELPDGPMAK